MPSAICKHPSCGTLIERPGFCTVHGDQQRAARAPRDIYYDQHIRNPESKTFYNSAAWQRARANKLAECPICEQCAHEWSEHVHHRKPLAECTPAERTDPRILMAVCPACHNALEEELRRAREQNPACREAVEVTP